MSHEWAEMLRQAQELELEAKGLLERAEALFSKAVDDAQGRFGPYDVNVAKCLLAFAQFLEQQRRFDDALLRFKLAASIYKRAGHGAAHSLAISGVQRMQEYLGEETS